MSSDSSHSSSPLSASSASATALDHSSGVSVQTSNDGNTMIRFPTGSSAGSLKRAHVNLFNLEEFLNSSSAVSVRGSSDVQSAVRNVMSGKSILTELPSDLSSRLESTQSTNQAEASKILKSQGKEALGQWLKGRMERLASTAQSWSDGTLASTDNGTAASSTSTANGTDTSASSSTNGQSAPSTSSSSNVSSTTRGTETASGSDLSASASATSPIPSVEVSEMTVTRSHLETLTRSYSTQNKACSEASTRYMHDKYPTKSMYVAMSEMMAGEKKKMKLPADLIPSMVEEEKQTTAAHTEAKSRGKEAEERWGTDRDRFLSCQMRAVFKTYMDGKGPLGCSTTSVPGGQRRLTSEASRIASTLGSEKVKELEAYIRNESVTEIGSDHWDVAFEAMRMPDAYGKQGVRPELQERLDEVRGLKWSGIQASSEWEKRVAATYLDDEGLAGAHLMSTAPTVSTAA